MPQKYPKLFLLRDLIEGKYNKKLGRYYFYYRRQHFFREKLTLNKFLEAFKNIEKFLSKEILCASQSQQETAPYVFDCITKRQTIYQGTTLVPLPCYRQP